MKLTELQPRWLINENGRKWFLFKSPHGNGNWITCRNFAWTESRHQNSALYELCPDLKGQPIVGCNPKMAWTIEGDFETLSVWPSLDCRASGNWHGYIRNGEVGKHLP